MNFENSAKIIHLDKKFIFLKNRKKLRTTRIIFTWKMVDCNPQLELVLYQKMMLKATYTPFHEHRSKSADFIKETAEEINTRTYLKSNFPDVYEYLKRNHLL